MTYAAPAIIDIRPADKRPAVANWLRGIGVRQVRLGCGLVMFSYIFSHFFNHALGNLSYDTMEAWAALPRLVVANPARQFYPLCRRDDPFHARALGALPAPAFSLHVSLKSPSWFSG
jgi:hypothetical protein